MIFLDKTLEYKIGCFLSPKDKILEQKAIKKPLKY
ncbi:MAG: hypothetical protein RLZZ231_1017 [Bacteroidota bacterium]|jgi:hypothetical protein